MNWKLRTFKAGDDETLVAIWNRTLSRDPITTKLLRRQTLANPNFRAEGCLIAESEQGPAGFVLTLAPKVSGLHAGTSGHGRIVGMGVAPEMREKGLGTELLEAAVKYLKEQGCGKVSVAAHEYYAAGVDREAYAEGISFLTKRGFKEVGQAVAMGRQLYDLPWPSETIEAEAKLAGEGIEAIYFEPAYTSQLLEYFRAEFADWVEFFTKKIDAGHDLDEMVIAVDQRAGKVIGYCQHLDCDHVGPFGVASAYRSRGIGSVMLYRLLDRMRAKGFRFAWFGETGKARPYYERAGFFVTRQYALLRREL